MKYMIFTPSNTFYKEKEQVCKNPPHTWEAYPDTVEGLTKIVDMEYKEFLSQSGKIEKMHEIVHLSTALQCLWEKLHAQ